MSTKDNLLLESDDRINRLLFELAKEQERLDRRRERFATDQLKQLELDRWQRDFDDRRRHFVRLKEQTAGL